MVHRHLHLVPDAQLMKPSGIPVMVAEHVASLSAIQSIVQTIHEQNDLLGLGVIASIRAGLVREKAIFEAELAEFRANSKIYLARFRPSSSDKPAQQDDDGLVRELIEARAAFQINLFDQVLHTLRVG